MLCEAYQSQTVDESRFAVAVIHMAYDKLYFFGERFRYYDLHNRISWKRLFSQQGLFSATCNKYITACCNEVTLFMM